MTAVLAFGFVNAQIYSANDATGFSAWTVYDNDGDGNDWGVLDMSTTTVPYPALIAMGETFASASWDGVGALTPDNIAVTPSIDCSANSSVFVNWNAVSPEGGTSTFYEEHYAVYCVTQTQLGVIIATSTYPAPIFEETLPAGGVIQSRSVDVSAIAGSQGAVYVVFRHFNCTDQNWLSIDDMSLTAASTASLEEIEKGTAVAFPNPAKEVLTIQTSLESTSISIIAMDGKVVATADMSGINGSINVANLVDGSYFYEVTASNGTVVRNTFVKK